MANYFIFPAIIALFLVGCITSSPGRVTSLDHPANPGAPEAKMGIPTNSLIATSRSEFSPVVEPQMQHLGHDLSKMQPQAPAAPSMNHNMAAMEMAAPSSQPATTQASTVFTCTMHPEITSDTPGNCPKCGMKLVLKKAAAR